MFDLTISALADGGYELSQLAGSLDEPCRIVLHAAQVRLLAERAGLIRTPGPSLKHIRRDLARLRDEAADLSDLLASGLYFPPQGDPSEDVVAAGELVESIDELLDAIDSESPVEPVTKCHEKSAAISVTKRGRPKKESALTPAERQRAHRERQAEPATAKQGVLV